MGDDIKMPEQPTYDDNGVVRFVPNRIVQYLLETHPEIDLNDIGANPEWTPEEQAQFAQLIGYSVSGWSGLSFVPEDKRELHYHSVAGMSEDEAFRRGFEAGALFVRERIACCLDELELSDEGEQSDG